MPVTLGAFDVIEALGLACPYLVGHSMGGMIAAEMAAVAPHVVERLGLIAPCGRQGLDLYFMRSRVTDVLAKTSCNPSRQSVS